MKLTTKPESLDIEFKKLNVGDLIVQQVPDPLNYGTIVSKRGIIIDINRNTCTIQWTFDTTNSMHDLTTTTILTSSLRNMIMKKVLMHYPLKM